jgi:phosphoenolpyruvate synthase/pyruvate phosphate dikinase
MPAILARRNTVTSDIEGMAKAAGILTGSGGGTSHAAVVARQLGKVGLVACPGLDIDLERRQCRIGGMLLDEGSMIALDVDTGAVHTGQLATQIERPDEALSTIAAGGYLLQLRPSELPPCARTRTFRSWRTGRRASRMCPGHQWDHCDGMIIQRL